jgi:nitroimidazol reductase NimA-like FMN-containing flavoprotein (pyridoxamine 5'-phosphate oxidase superfamily)
MPATTPTTKLDSRFSDPQAAALPWPEVQDRLAAAGTYWVTTVRADGRPHITPLFAVWDEGALHFCTGPTEQKARNLETSRHVALTTGTSATDEGVDIVVEGTAEPVHDEDRLRRLSDLWAAKYGEEWRFDVRDGDFAHEAGTANVYAVAPDKVLAFGKAPYSHTSFRFER